jgi:hypothetical protein
VREQLPPVQELFGLLQKLVKAEEQQKYLFFPSHFSASLCGLWKRALKFALRFKDYWKISLQNAVFILALVVWLEEDRLVTPQEIEEMLKSISFLCFTIV